MSRSNGPAQLRGLNKFLVVANRLLPDGQGQGVRSPFFRVRELDPLAQGPGIEVSWGNHEIQHVAQLVSHDGVCSVQRSLQHLGGKLEMAIPLSPRVADRVATALLEVRMVVTDLPCEPDRTRRQTEPHLGVNPTLVH
jgi:hypothetical protein